MNGVGVGWGIHSWCQEMYYDGEGTLTSIMINTQFDNDSC